MGSPYSQAAIPMAVVKYDAATQTQGGCYFTQITSEKLGDTDVLDLGPGRLLVCS